MLIIILGSNACTLIAVLLAGRIDEYKIQLWGYIDQPLSRMLVNSLGKIKYKNIFMNPKKF